MARPYLRQKKTQSKAERGISAGSPREERMGLRTRPELNGGRSISRMNGVRGVADAGCSVARNRHDRAREEKK